MADKYWKGGDGSTDAEKGDFNRNGNWKDAVGGASTVPTSSDKMIFDSRAEIASGSGNPHTDGKHWNCYDNMGSGPDDCQGVVVTAGFTGFIGRSSVDDSKAPLQLSLAAGKELVYRGNSEAYFMIKTAAKTVPKVVFDSVSGILTLSGVNETDAVWTLIECYGGGTLELEADTLFTDIYNYSTISPIASGAINIIINKNCPAGNVYTWGGTVSCDSPLVNLAGYGAAAFVVGQTSLTNPPEDLDVAFAKWHSTGTYTQRAAGRLSGCEQRAGKIELVGPGDKTIGVRSTLDNAAAVDKSNGLVGIPITGNSFVVGHTAVFSGTTNYEGVHVIVSKSTDEIVIPATYAAETFGGTEIAATRLVIEGGTFDTSEQKGSLTLDTTCQILDKPGGAVTMPIGTLITAFTTGN